MSHICKSLKLMGKKRGMTQLFDEKGYTKVCTVVEIEPNVVTQIKTNESDGYSAIQLGFEKIQTKDPRTIEKRVAKPLRGHFAKASVEPRRYLTESRIDSTEEYKVGQEIDVSVLEGIRFVDATAESKGKGYQGVMKKHNFSGGPASHGSGFHRHAGSRGMRSTPGRVLPGTPAASQMGNETKTMQNLEIVKVVPEKNLIVIKGSIPGPRNGLVKLQASVKKSSKQQQL